MEQMTFLDFFAGIGGFRKGFELCGMRCVGHCEIYTYIYSVTEPFTM